MLAARRLPPLAAAILPLLAGGCSSTSYVNLDLPPAQHLAGTAVTTGYTGTLEAGSCRGEYTGRLGASEAPIVLSCTDGTHGTGRVLISDGQVGSGTLRLADGTHATISARSPSFASAHLDPGHVPFLRPFQQARAAWDRTHPDHGATPSPDPSAQRSRKMTSSGANAAAHRDQT